MISKSNLAIVIPAYKSTYLSYAIESIMNQTCKDFTLYIGDDSSPMNLKEVIDRFDSSVEIVYKRFDSNLGGTDLVSHWNRCIDLIGSEEWIWLFSDDDIMEKNCVEEFYKSLRSFPQTDLFHFNVDIIDGNNNKIKSCEPFPSLLSTSEFFSKRHSKKGLHSFVVEYIFSKEVYEVEGKFQKFDLAWSSDDASWIKFSKRHGIRTIQSAKVLWRYSSINISSLVSDQKILERKLDASIEYLLWVKRYFHDNRIEDNTSSFSKVKWPLYSFVLNSNRPFMKKYSLVLQSLKRLNLYKLKYIILGYLLLSELKVNVFRILNLRRVEV